MSQFMYISSPKELGIGSFGTREVEITSFEVVDGNKFLVNGTREIKDSLGILKDKDLNWVQNNIHIFDGRPGGGLHISEGFGYINRVSRHFTNAYIYGFSFTLYSGFKPMLEKMDDLTHDKKVFYNYLKDNSDGVEYFELFSSWADEEAEERNKSKDLDITLADIEKMDYFTLYDRQYIRIRV